MRFPEDKTLLLIKLASRYLRINRSCLDVVLKYCHYALHISSLSSPPPLSGLVVCDGNNNNYFVRQSTSLYKCYSRLTYIIIYQSALSAFPYKLFMVDWACKNFQSIDQSINQSPRHLFVLITGPGQLNDISDTTELKELLG